MSLIYCEHLVNVHFGNIPHSFIPHITLHSAEKIRSEFSANYPDNFPHSAKYPFPEWSTDAENQASGQAYGGAEAGGSLIIGQSGIWSAGGRLIILIRVRPRSLA